MLIYQIHAIFSVSKLSIKQIAETLRRDNIFQCTHQILSYKSFGPGYTERQKSHV